MQMVIGIVERTAVMRPQDKEAHRLGIEFLQHFTNAEKIAQGLGHFFVVHAHEAVMHPIVHKGMVMRAFGLRDFVFMVRELQILPTAVNIELRAEIMLAHHRAFNVPTGTALTPRRIPGWLTRFCSLP